jgi:hypothetical protein
MVSRLAAAEADAATKAKATRPKAKKRVPKKKKLTLTQTVSADSTPPRSVVLADSDEQSDGETAAVQETQRVVQGLQVDNRHLQQQLDEADAQLARIPALEEDSEELRAQVSELKAQLDVWEDQRRAWELERRALVSNPAGISDAVAANAHAELAKRLEDTESQLARAQDLARDEANRAETVSEDREVLRDRCIDAERKLATLEHAQREALARSASSIEDADMYAKQRIEAAESAAREKLEQTERASRQRMIEMEAKVAEAEARVAMMQRREEEESSAKRGLMDQLRKLRSEMNLVEDELRKVCAERNELPTLCQHCGLPWDGSAGESAAAMAAAAAARERVDGRDEPVIAAAFGPERLAGIERAVALLREEHAKELDHLGQAVVNAKQRTAEADSQRVKLEHEIVRVLELKELAERNATRALEAMEATVRAAEERAAEAHRRADMSVVSARESAQSKCLAPVRCITPALLLRWSASGIGIAVTELTVAAWANHMSLSMHKVVVYLH